MEWWQKDRKSYRDEIGRKKKDRKSFRDDIGTKKKKRIFIRSNTETTNRTQKKQEEGMTILLK